MKVRIYGIIIRKRKIAAVKIFFFVYSDKKFLFIKKQARKQAMGKIIISLLSAT